MLACCLLLLTCPSCRCEKERAAPDLAVELRESERFAPPPPPPPESATTRAQLEFATTDTSDAEPLGEPRPGDWLDVHSEPGQNFEVYATSAPPGPTPTRRELVLLPLGPLDPPQRSILSRIAEFTALWFMTPTRIAPGLPLPGPPDRRVRSGERHGEQYLTSVFLDDVLPREIPPTAIAFLGITMADLYPGPGWNFVFGQAHLFDRLGVFSLLRLGPDWAGVERTPETERLELRRALLVITHELGHMFGLPHCSDYACNMNGSNSLDETDRAPLHLCPECLRKLQWNLGFDVLARANALAAFLERSGLADDAAWYRARAARIREQ